MSSATAADVDHKGSGIALFLEEFLPSNTEGSDKDGIKTTTYTTSLLNVPNANKDFVQQSEYERGVSKDDDEEQMTYREWRDEQKRVLMDFLVQRMTEHSDDDESDEVDDEQVDEHEEQDNPNTDGMTETQPETQPMFETQPETQPVLNPETSENESESERPLKRRKRQVTIPYIEDTVHEISKLEYLDLYSQRLNLSLCRVLKVWPLRDTKRGGVGTSQYIARKCPQFQHTSVPMPRIPFGEMEEDGPVASTFKSVLSMEVEQIKLMNLPGTSTNKRLRVKLFFYNAYAKAIDIWLHQQRQKKRGNLWLSLSHIPAVCVFPRAFNPDNWVERHDMVEYCVCIGDKSSAKSLVDGSFIRFDDEFLRVNIASQSILRDDVEAGESGILPEELLLAQQLCDSTYFLSGSEESEATRRKATASVSIQNAWSSYIHQRHEKEKESTTVDDGGQWQEGSREGQQSTNEAQQTEHVSPVEPITFEGDAKREPPSTISGYVRLSNLPGILKKKKEEGNKRSFVNLYGLVMGFTSPSQTRRGDWMMTAMLVDESCTTPVTIVMFAGTPTQLPKLLWMGDVLRVHRAEPQEYLNDVQILAMKFKSSFVVVRKTPENGWIGLPSASKSFSFDAMDGRRSQALWHWGQDFICTSPTIHKDHYFTLAEMTGMSNDEEEKLKDRDITVMVAGIYPYPQHPSGITPRGILRIWDGTGIPPSDPFPVKTMYSQQAENIGDPPPDALAQLVKTVQKLRESNVNLQVPLSFCGRVSNVLVWEEVHWSLLKDHVEVGTFIRLRNVDIRRWQFNQFRSLMVHSKSWLSVLPSQNYEVRKLLEAHNSRVLRREYNPKAGILPNRNTKISNPVSRPSVAVETEERVVWGLKHFADEADVGKYTGVLTLRMIPPNLTRSEMMSKLERSSGPTIPFVLAVQDQTFSVVVLASEKIRQMLHRMISQSRWNAWNDIPDAQKQVSATVRSVDWDGKRYFVLADFYSTESDDREGADEV